MATATRIDGKALAAELSATIAAETEILLKEHGIRPGLDVVIVGDDPASQVYVRNKKRTAEACGFRSVRHSLPEDVDQATVLELIDTLNNDDQVHGILVQLPLPDHARLDPGQYLILGHVVVFIDSRPHGCIPTKRPVERL